MTVYQKDPAAQVDYALNWAQDYLQAGEQIIDSQWTVFPAGGALDLAIMGVPSEQDGITRVMVEKGIAGCVYALNNMVTTSQGRRDERHLTIRVAER